MAFNLSAASLSQIASSSSSSSACGHHFVFLKHKHNPLKLRQFSSSTAFVQAESTESGFSDPQLPSSPSSSPESASSSRSQLDLLEQLTSGTGYDSDGTSYQLTIREQLARLAEDRDEDFSIQLGKNLKKVSPKFLTTSQKRNIKRQAYLNEVSKRNDSVFFATIGAFVLLPPVIILGIAIALGYVQLFP